LHHSACFGAAQNNDQYGLEEEESEPGYDSSDREPALLHARKSYEVDRYQKCYEHYNCSSRAGHGLSTRKEFNRVMRQEQNQ